MTISRTRLGAITALFVALTLTACGTTTPESTEEESTAIFNEADVMFAQMMIPHHTQAVEMSDIILEKDGISAETIELADQIKAEQQPEIEQLEGFLDEWGVEPMSEDMSAMDHSMPGMMTDDDLNALFDAEGSEAERLFLEHMTEHHEGAIDMANTEISDGENAEAIELAESIVTAQEEEIAQMDELLAAL